MKVGLLPPGLGVAFGVIITVVVSMIFPAPLGVVVLLS